jgi:hypothetical protein
MGSLVSDAITGDVDPRQINAACNAAGKQLRYVELAHKYGGKAIPDVAVSDLDGESVN